MRFDNESGFGNKDDTPSESTAVRYEKVKDENEGNPM